MLKGVSRMITLSVNHKNDTYEEFTSTALPFVDGYLIQNDCVRFDDIKNLGVRWEVSFFAIEKEDKEGTGGTIRTNLIVPPEKLDSIDWIALNGMKIYSSEDSTSEETEYDV